MAEITEEWLASVGFKYREPGEREAFRHWTLTFSEPDDDGMYLETTKPGWMNAVGRFSGGSLQCKQSGFPPHPPHQSRLSYGTYRQRVCRVLCGTHGANGALFAAVLIVEYLHN